MGQRLIIEVFNQGKALANAYFHEGAYTNSALAVISRILENQDSVKKPALQTVSLIRFCML